MIMEHQVFVWTVIGLAGAITILAVWGFGFAVLWLGRQGAIRWAIRQTEITTCPRRAEGVRAVVEGLDAWERGRWGWWFRLQDWFRRHVTMKGRFYGGTYFPKGHRPPRTCSYCGGGHPDDLIAMVKAGWSVEGTTKGYKRYLKPPGYHEAMLQWDRDRDRRTAGEPFSFPTVPECPVPPVKLYVQHFSKAQIASMNSVLNERQHAEA